MNKTKLLRINEVAVLLGVTPLTLRRWDNNGRLKAVRVGSRGDRRYREDDIQELIKKGKI